MEGPPTSHVRPPSGRERHSYRALATALVLFSAAALLILLLRYSIIHILLLFFAGALAATLLNALSDGVSRATKLAHGWSLAAVIAGLVLLAALGVWLLLPQLYEQFAQLGDRLPGAIEQFRRRLQGFGWSRYLLRSAGEPADWLGSPDMFSQATGIVSTAFSAVVQVIVVLFVGIYLADEPALYGDGVVRLAPRRHRLRVRETLETCGYTLRWWLIGQAITMVVIGTLTAAGLWLLGVPLWLPLGILAALFNFIPNFGPLVSFIPAELIALTIRPSLAIYVLILYVAAQSLEGYVLTPMVQRRAVLLPPALTILMQVLMGWLVGALGVMLAAPLTAVLIVIVKMLYVEDTLEDRMLVPGEAKAKRKAKDEHKEKLKEMVEERREADQKEKQEAQAPPERRPQGEDRPQRP